MKVTKIFPVKVLSKRVDGYLAEDRHVYVALQDFCDVLGLDALKYWRVISEDEVISDRLVKLCLDIPASAGEETREAWYLHADLIPGVLAFMDSRQVKGELHSELVRYQKMVMRALWEYTKGAIVSKGMREKFGL
jgi:hypothetical protein